MAADCEQPVEMGHVVTDRCPRFQPGQRFLAGTRTPEKVGRIGGELVSGVVLEYRLVVPHAAHDEVRPAVRLCLIGKLLGAH